MKEHKFNKRHLFNQIGALRPLDNRYRVPGSSKVVTGCASWRMPPVFMKVLDFPSAPFDKHRFYQLVLLEYDFSGVAPLIARRPFFVMTAFDDPQTAPIKRIRIGADIAELPILRIYIHVNRGLFPPKDEAEELRGWLQNVATRRAHYIAHELNYVAQYPSIVDRQSGDLSFDVLRRNVVEPTPEQDDDLVCPYSTIDALLDEYRIPAQTSQEFLNEQGTQKITRYYDRWLEDYSVDRCTVYYRTLAYLDTGLRNGFRKHLTQAIERCSSLHAGSFDVCRKASRPGICSTCPGMDSLVQYFRESVRDEFVDRPLVTRYINAK